MESKPIRSLKKGLFLIGLIVVLVFMGMPANADTLAHSSSQSGTYIGVNSAFLNSYSTSGFSLPKSPALGTAFLTSGYTSFLPTGRAGPIAGLPVMGNSAGTQSLISSVLNNYKTGPVAFTDYSYIASSGVPTCYGV